MSDEDKIASIFHRMMRDLDDDDHEPNRKPRCEGYGACLPLKPYTRSTVIGTTETLMYCEECARTAAIMGTTVRVSRKEMLRVRDLADKRMLPTSLYRGKRIIGYRESMGGDNKWHAHVVLEGRERVFLDESDPAREMR